METLRERLQLVFDGVIDVVVVDGVTGVIDMISPAVCCSVLQCVAVRCSALQCVAVRCSALQCVAVCCSVLMVSPVLST